MAYGCINTNWNKTIYSSNVKHCKVKYVCREEGDLLCMWVQEICKEMHFVVRQLMPLANYEHYPAKKIEMKSPFYKYDF